MACRARCAPGSRNAAPEEQIRGPPRRRPKLGPFHDLCRAAQVSDLVARSISGHATETTQRHYSTVALDEQRRGLSNVIQLLKPTASAPEVGRDVGRIPAQVRRIGEEDRVAI
jgi:hypothetical protein